MSGDEMEKLYQEFEKHQRAFEDFKKEQEKRWDQVLDMVQQNTIATRNLTKSTEGIIQLYNDVHGAIRVGVGIQQFVIWSAKWGVVGTLIAAAVTYITTNWSVK